MEIIEYPSRDDWNKITERPHLDTLALHEKVRKILKENIYPFLLYFDKLYIKTTEKNKF